MKRSSFFLFAPFIFAALTMPQMCKAQNSGETASKPVQMIIGFGSGGGYDLWGRSVARHMGRHLPGKPTMIAQNMPGAGSFAAANYIYNIAPKDGSVLALIARDAPLGPLVGVDGARFDPRKLSWIGTSAKETNVCVSYHTAAVKTIEDLYTKQLIIGDSGAGDGTYIYPRALIDLLGLKFKQVSGFPSSSDVILAMERGEVEAICESLDSVKARRSDWIKTKRINIILQGALQPDPELPDVPFALDLAKDNDTRLALQLLFAGQAIGRPFIAPPDLSLNILSNLRKGFNATMEDPEFLADARNQKLTPHPATGEYLQSIIEIIYSTPKPIVERVGKLMK